MLNIAIPLAKDRLLVFGNMDLFQPGYSGSENQYTDILVYNYFQN